MFAVKRFIGFAPSVHHQMHLFAKTIGHNTDESSSMMDRRAESMIVGLGTDLAEIARIEQSIARYGQRFLERIYTPAEIAYCQRKKSSGESFAARFAAKEAGAKALGTGISHGVSWHEFEVHREPSGKPVLHLSGRAAELAAALGANRTSISLTHTRTLAMAVVILEAVEGDLFDHESHKTLGAPGSRF
jgi:holo-[acyl-carrier protein] synthase